MVNNFTAGGFGNKYEPVTRRPAEQITMTQGRFCKWLAKEKGLSAESLMAAMTLIGDSLVLAMARGYRIQWRGLLNMELREMKPRKRYHRLKKVVYEQAASCIVHIQNASDLNKRVRALAEKELHNAVRHLSLTRTKQD